MGWGKLLLSTAMFLSLVGCAENDGGYEETMYYDCSSGCSNACAFEEGIDFAAGMSALAVDSSEYDPESGTLMLQGAGLSCVAKVHGDTIDMDCKLDGVDCGPITYKKRRPK